MKKHLTQYLNEILSITIMLLMAVALIAGQATPMAAGADNGSENVAYQAGRVAVEE